MTDTSIESENPEGKQKQSRIQRHIRISKIVMKPFSLVLQMIYRSKQGVRTPTDELLLVSATDLAEKIRNKEVSFLLIVISVKAPW